MAVNKKTKYIIGIDEVGRGPVAGPVAVGAVAYRAGLEKALKKEIKGVRDSKKLPMHKREAIFDSVREKQKEGQIDYVVAFVGPELIDRKGIACAIRRALKASLRRLNLDPGEVIVLLDGGLRAPEEYLAQETIIRGDDSEFAIALASIMAKVSRDARMVKAGGKFPEYKFEQHKGYGTAEHMRHIKRFGLTTIHRKSFLKSIDTR